MPHLTPPVGHTLAEGTQAKDLAMATLTQPFSTTSLAKAGAKAFAKSLVDLISTQTFMDHTVQDLDEEEEMEVPSPSPPLCPTLAGQSIGTSSPNKLTAPPSGLSLA